MKRSGAVLVAAFAAPLSFLASCGSEPAEGPPPIHLGDSLCAECDMIISDLRFATAAVNLDERSRRITLLFDDFNCQAAYEAERPNLQTIERRAHDHASSRPIRTENASLVHAERRRTPVASPVAAFELASPAKVFAGSLGGARLWCSTTRGVASNGSPAAPGPARAAGAGGSDRPAVQKLNSVWIQNRVVSGWPELPS